MDTMESLKHARLALLVKSDLTVHKLTDHMDKETSVIWIRIGHKRKNSIMIGRGSTDSISCWDKPRKMPQCWSSKGNKKVGGGI